MPVTPALPVTSASDPFPMDYSKKRGQKYHDTHKAREIELMSLRNRRGIYQQIADKMVVCSDEFASN